MVWPEDHPFTLQQRASIQAGGPVNISELHMSSHTGTHVDAPFHFVSDGRTMEQVDLDRFLGPAVVVEARGECIDLETVENAAIRRGDIVLFKTDNSERQKQDTFQEDYAYVSEEAALYLVAQGVKGIGVDYLSIAQFGRETVVHRIALGAELSVIENLVLDHVLPGRYLLAALPLKITGGDGSPVRAVLVDGISGFS